MLQQQCVAMVAAGSETTAYQESDKAGIRGEYDLSLKVPSPTRGRLVSAFWYLDIQTSNTSLPQCHFKYDGTINA